MSNLLNEASLIVTPNGYKEGKLYSVIPSDGSGDMSVTRATTATRVNSAGLVELVPYNLFSYSEQFNNAYWEKGSATVTANATTAPDETLTADKFQEIATNDTHQIYIAYTGNIGVATISLYAKKAERSAIQITTDQTTDPIAFFNLDTGVVHSSLNCTPFIENVGNGWYRCGFTYTIDQATSYPVFRVVDSNFDTVYTGTAGYGVYIWGAQLNEGTLKPYQKTETRLNIPRLDYSNGTCPSILLEPQRTNLFTYSSSFDNAAWTSNEVAIASNSTTAPDGTLTAETLTASTTNAAHYIFQSINTNSGSTLTFSCFVKNNGGNYVQFLAGGISFTITNPYQNFDLINGTLAQGTIPNSTIENVGNGWYRISSTIEAAASGSAGYFLCPILNGTTGRLDVFTGNGTSGVYIWGAQLEAGSYATSYIPTAATSVTRNADSVSKTGISSLIGQTEGTIFLHMNNLAIDSDWLTLNPISGSPYTNGIGIGYYANSVRLQIYSPSGTVFGTMASISGNNKIALAYKSGDTAIYINGVNVFSSSNAFSFNVLLDSITVASQSWLAGSIAANKIYSHSLYTTRLTNTQLAQLTSL